MSYLDCIIDNHHYPHFLTAIEKQNSHGCALEEMPFSGTKISMTRPIVCRLLKKEIEQIVEEEFHVFSHFLFLSPPASLLP